MSEELDARREHVISKITAIIEPLDDSIKALHNEMLATDPSEELDEVELVERLEGFHDYLVLSEVVGIQHPTLEDFDNYKLDNPDALLSFGAGKHRESLESDEVAVDDTVPEEELKQDIATDDGMALAPPEIISQPVAPESTDDEELESDGWVKEGDNAEEPVEETTEAEETVEPEGESVTNEETDEDETADRVPGRIDAQAVSDKAFERKRGGYSEDDVDKVLDEVIIFLDAEHSVEEYEAKIAELSKVEFRKPIFAQGLNPAEVDGFISAIIAELTNRSTNTGK